MPRPCRRRRVRRFPDYWEFSAEDGVSEGVIFMGIDEYEVLRLIDYEGMTQEECANSMGVARTTVTSIYTNARSKISKLIVEGKRLRITGGAYQICSETEISMTRKEEGRMRIAVTYDNGQVFQHFGHTEQFKLYDVADGRITGEQIVQSTGEGHGCLAGMLKELQVDKLICGGIGMGARTALAEAGIELLPGVTGSADDAVGDLLRGELQYSSEEVCNGHEDGSGCGQGTECHHGHGHHEHGCHHGHDHGEHELNEQD